VLVGEVHTAILQHSSALRATDAAGLVNLVAGEPTILYHRPIQYVRSPSILIGVDCQMGGVSGGLARALGTVSCRATVTGGRIVQGSSFSELCSAADGRRRPWSAYLSQPETLQTSGGPTTNDLGVGFVDGSRRGGVDLAAVSERMVDALQRGTLDRRPPLKVPRTRLRWFASIGPIPRVHYAIEGATLRTVRLVVAAEEMALVRGFCEDLALHDWLLSCASRVLDGMPGADSPWHSYRRLKPLVDHVLHLWMPVARPHESLLSLWESLDGASGMSRQWQTIVGRIRDQVNTNAAVLMEQRSGSGETG
jgi:hypothetical protein